MLIVEHPAKCRSAVREAQKRGMTVGLVPTMGALHDGHLSLIKTAREQCDTVAVTIFVNPTQFGPNEDLEAYPRPLEQDLDKCREHGATMVFTPSVETMYPQGGETSIHVGGVTEGLCGRSRPSHFDGVATIVAKLFHILPVDVAFFGEKDYQQLVMIRKMVRDLDLPIEIVGCPTIRESDGVAMSSRNAYLSAEQRVQATVLYRSIVGAAALIEQGNCHVPELVEAIRAEIAAAGPVEIEYVEVVDAATLEILSTVDRPARICLAVKIGVCRLIDNVGVAV